MAYLNEIPALITAAVGLTAAIPTLYSWVAMRKRSKLKADIDLLKALQESARKPQAADSMDELAPPPAILAADKHIADAINMLSEKISCKMEAFRGPDPDRRGDPDFSSVFMGSTLVFIAVTGRHYVHVVEQELLYLKQFPKRAAGDDIDRKLRLIGHWESTITFLMVVLIVIGCTAILFGFRRTGWVRNSVLAKPFGVTPWPATQICTGTTKGAAGRSTEITCQS